MDFAISYSSRVWVVESTRASQCNAFQPHISRTVRICMGRMAARFANKVVSRLPVCLFRVTTLTARLASMSRVNPQQRNASAGALVFQKGTQLRERPTVHLCPLALPSQQTRKEGDASCATTSVSQLSNPAPPSDPLARAMTFEELWRKQLVSSQDKHVYEGFFEEGWNARQPEINELRQEIGRLTARLNDKYGSMY